MTATFNAGALAPEGIGAELHAIASAIFPICRSLTGDGVRQTLRLLGEHVPLTVHEVPSGTPVLDWTVPPEWNIRGAWIRNEQGETVVDFQDSNLHVIGYCAPVRARLPLAELRQHIITLPDQPDLIPARTSYYEQRWAFCMAHNKLQALPDGIYEVCVDSSLEPGSLTYGEYLHRGESEEEFLLSAHICHPSLANDNCSGLALLAALGRRLQGMRTRLSYRLLFAPSTIGSITWLARNRDGLHRIRHGLVLSCLGDGGGPIYKRSRRGDAGIDRIMAAVVRQQPGRPEVVDFSPYGYDERQYCSPGFNLPVGLVQRSCHGTFPEYHTSADNLDFIRPEHLESSARMVAAAIDIAERDRVLVNTHPFGEPQLGKRGLYRAVGGDRAGAGSAMAMLWVLNLADGEHSLLDMAVRSGLPFAAIADTAAVLEQHGLLAGGG